MFFWWLFVTEDCRDAGWEGLMQLEKCLHLYFEGAQLSTITRCVQFHTEWPYHQWGALFLLMCGLLKVTTGCIVMHSSLKTSPAAAYLLMSGCTSLFLGPRVDDLEVIKIAEFDQILRVQASQSLRCVHINTMQTHQDATQSTVWLTKHTENTLVCR